MLQELDIVIVDITNQVISIIFHTVTVDVQFHNGTYFILMMGLLEGYFVPLHHYRYNPSIVDEKVHVVMW